MVQIEAALTKEPNIDCSALWKTLLSGKANSLSGGFFFDNLKGTPLEISDVSEYLEKYYKDYFSVALKSGEVELTYIADVNLYRLDIKNLARSKRCAEEWITPIISHPNFLQARIYDEEYDLWQNMTDLSFYEEKGKDHSQLPKTSNNLPFPLTEEVIDTSHNPGRFILRNGHIESVGGTMWIHNDLLETLNSNLKPLENDSNFSLTNLGSVLKIETPLETFKSDHGTEKNLQQKLRSCIFNSHSKGA